MFYCRRTCVNTSDTIGFCRCSVVARRNVKNKGAYNHNRCDCDADSFAPDKPNGIVFAPIRQSPFRPAGDKCSGDKWSGDKWSGDK